MANSSAGASVLEKISKDTFNLVAYSGTVYFHRDTENKIDSIKIEAQDVLLEGKKEANGSASQISTNGFDVNVAHEAVNGNSRSCSCESSVCSPLARFFNLHEPVLISSSPMITMKGINFFSPYLNCLSNLAGS